MFKTFTLTQHTGVNRGSNYYNTIISTIQQQSRDVCKSSCTAGFHSPDCPGIDICPQGKALTSSNTYLFGTNLKVSYNCYPLCTARVFYFIPNHSTNLLQHSSWETLLDLLHLLSCCTKKVLNFDRNLGAYL